MRIPNPEQMEGWENISKKRAQTRREKKAEKTIHLPARMKAVRGRGKYNSSDKTMAKRKRKAKKIRQRTDIRAPRNYAM
jgi:hypothetical protein